MYITYKINKIKIIFLLLVIKFLCKYCTLLSIFLLIFFLLCITTSFSAYKYFYLVWRKYLNLQDVFHFDKRSMHLNLPQGRNPRENENPVTYFHKFKFEKNKKSYNHPLYSPTPVYRREE